MLAVNAANRAWEGNATPAVTAEQKNRAMASPISVQSVQSNKEGLRMNRRSRLAESH